MKRRVNKEVKVLWLSRMYFGVSHAIDYPINPYDELDLFLNSKVGSLSWSNDKKASKERFTKKFQQLLELYSINLSQKHILAELEKDNLLNNEVVERWADHSEFPSNW